MVIGPGELGSVPQTSAIVKAVIKRGKLSFIEGDAEGDMIEVDDETYWYIWYN